MDILLISYISEKYMFSKKIALISLAILMGTTFSLGKTALHFLPPLEIIELRYFSASCLSLLLSYKSLFKINLYDLISGIAIATLIFLGHTFHTIGLQYINGSQSAFIIAFYVPLVPFLQAIMTKNKPDFLTWVAVFFSFIGLIILTGYQNLFSFHWGKGEMMTFLSALTLAISVTLTGKLAPHMKNTCNVATVQLISCTIFSLVIAHQTPLTLPHFSWLWTIPIAILAFISAYKQFVMNWVQQTISPSHVTLIISIEPVVASFIGWMQGETISLHVLLGGLVILSSFIFISISFKHVYTKKT